MLHNSQQLLNTICSSSDANQERRLYYILIIFVFIHFYMLVSLFILSHFHIKFLIVECFVVFNLLLLLKLLNRVLCVKIVETD